MFMDQGRLSQRENFYGTFFLRTIFILFLFTWTAALSAQGSPFFNGNRESGSQDPLAQSIGGGQVRDISSDSGNMEKGDSSIHKTPIPPRSSDQKNIGTGKRSFINALFSVMGSLFLVIALFLGVIYFLKRIAPQQKALLAPDLLHCVGQYPLTPKIRLYLLLFGSRLILISSTGDSIECISEIDDPREIDAIIRNHPDSFKGISPDFSGKRSSKNGLNDHSVKNESEDRFCV